MDVKRMKYAVALRSRLSRGTSVGLRVEDEIGPDEIVAIYRDDDGNKVFAFCLDGLIVDPNGRARFIPFRRIVETSYRDSASLRLEKAGKMLETISLTLDDTEVIDLKLASRPDQFSERLAIGGLIEQRVRLARAA